LKLYRGERRIKIKEYTDYRNKWRNVEKGQVKEAKNRACDIQELQYGDCYPSSWEETQL
jgi:hypothetical protein